MTAPQNPVRAGNPGIRDLPHRAATRGTFPGGESCRGLFGGPCMNHRAEIMALPVSERLDYALSLLDAAYGDEDNGALAWVKERFGLSKTKGRVLIALNSAFPRVLTREHIQDITPGGQDNQSSNLPSVYISYLRAALAANNGPEIELVWGVGYRLTERIDIGSAAPAWLGNRHNFWSAQDDSDLLAMRDSGSTISAMAYELDRTERAIIERLRHHRGKGAA